jgi:hypothetical protein
MCSIYQNTLKIFFFGIFLIVLGFTLALSHRDILTYGVVIAGSGISIVILILFYTFIYVNCIEPYYDKKKNIIIYYNHAFDTDLILNKPTIEEETCSICLKKDNQVSKLKCCNYYAHQNCIKEWYNLNPTKNECFICKNNF